MIAWKKKESDDREEHEGCRIKEVAAKEEEGEGSDRGEESKFRNQSSTRDNEKCHE
jgi:hypothetical protein